MTQKIAVLILHGAGTPENTFADQMIEDMTKMFHKKVKDVHGQPLVFEPVFWSSVFEPEEERLWKQLQTNAELDFPALRQFTVQFLADAVAYQPASVKDTNYDKVHALLAESLQILEKKAGPEAPLCVISHSLGTVVASNYFYDLQLKQTNIGNRTKKYIKRTPLSRGSTLALFYTLGSPLALWSLRFKDFGAPIQVPSCDLNHYYPCMKGEWVNMYDKDDILSYPLKGLNRGYDMAVTEDMQINAGGLLSSWNPLSHLHYDSNEKVLTKITNGLVQVWENAHR